MHFRQTFECNNSTLDLNSRLFIVAMSLFVETHLKNMFYINVQDFHNVTMKHSLTHNNILS